MLMRAARLRKLAAYKRQPEQDWRRFKNRLYQWGENQCMKRLLPDPVIKTMEIIVQLVNINLYSQATIQAILHAYNTKHPNHTISRSALYNYLNVLIKHKLIKRFNQLEWNKSVITKLLAPKLVNTSVQMVNANNLSQDKLSIEASNAAVAALLAPHPTGQYDAKLTANDIKTLIAGNNDEQRTRSNSRITITI